MTDTRDQIATLRELLPEIESGEGSLGREKLGRLICALKGHEYGFADWATAWRYTQTFTIRNNDGKVVAEYYAGHLPDTNLQAADYLAREVLPGWFRESGTRPLQTFCTLAGPNTNLTATHPTSEPRAILAALVRAKIAELEAEDASI